MVSFYAEARDHRQTARSALYFVDARPFDKRYRQTQAAGAGGGAGGGDGLELSARQRDIVSATWNLIRERDAGTRHGDDLRDQVDMVAILQRTLKDQVETLVARAQGRRLADDAGVEPFVAELETAAEEMEVAAELLAGQDLDGAVSPAQRALQHLLTAEASLRDVDVSLTRRRSGGDSVSRSLSELVDLELDTQRNRYENPSTPSFGERREADDTQWRQLTELARRHEELARQRERGAASDESPSRWQLQRLQRQIESLREQLAADRSQRSADAAASRSRAGPAGGDAVEEIDQARDLIEQALAADDVSSAADTTEALRRGAEALRRGAERIRRGERDDLADRVRRAQRAAEALGDDQARILERLQALRDDALEAARGGDDSLSPSYGMEADAATKRRMQRDLARIAADLADARQRVAQSADVDQAVARQLDRALDELAESRVAERLSIAADYFEAGRPLFLIGQEDRVQTALAQFANRIGRAADRLDAAGRAERGPNVDDVQALRRQLQAVGSGGEPTALRELAAAARRLAAEALDGSGSLDRDAARRLAEASAGRYQGRGAADANAETLFRMTLARLDQIEMALGEADGAGIRSHRPRDGAYDDQAVARYFRQLSCGGADC